LVQTAPALTAANAGLKGRSANDSVKASPIGRRFITKQ